MVRCQEQPGLIFIERELIGSDFRHLAGQSGLVQREDGVAPGSDDQASAPAGPPQRIPERPTAVLTLEKMQVIDDQGHNGEAQRIADLMPQLPLISDLRGVETYHRPRLGTPLP